MGNREECGVVSIHRGRTFKWSLPAQTIPWFCTGGGTGQVLWWRFSSLGWWNSSIPSPAVVGAILITPIFPIQLWQVGYQSLKCSFVLLWSKSFLNPNPKPVTNPIPTKEGKGGFCWHFCGVNCLFFIEFYCIHRRLIMDVCWMRCVPQKLRPIPVQLSCLYWDWGIYQLVQTDNLQELWMSRVAATEENDLCTFSADSAQWTIFF